MSGKFAWDTQIAWGKKSCLTSLFLKKFEGKKRRPCEIRTRNSQREVKKKIFQKKVRKKKEVHEGIELATHEGKSKIFIKKFLQKILRIISRVSKIACVYWMQNFVLKFRKECWTWYGCIETRFPRSTAKILTKKSPNFLND